jgi:hypothetical protein
MPPLPLEIVAGAMGILRIGPVSIPLHSMVRIAMRSEKLLVLRWPRLEVQTFAGVAGACEIVDIWVGDERPRAAYEDGPMGVIRAGELIQAILMNHSTGLRNATVVVEGDAARIVHWAVDCADKAAGGCPDCRWRTRCRHEECERSSDVEMSCHLSREEEHLKKLALSAGVAGEKQPGGLWRPWNPLGG